MQRALNVKNFRSFAEQAKGFRVTEISVARASSAKGPILKYRAKDPRTRRHFNGEWILPKDEKDAAAEKEFFELAEKEFHVTREDGGESKPA